MAKSGVRWSDIKSLATRMDHSELVDLIRDLYRISAENRTFLAARLLPDTGAGIEEYRHRIVEQFKSRYSFPPLKLGVARRAIREYRSATGDMQGTLDLLLTYLESGTECTLEYGDLDEDFYDSLVSVVHEVEKTLLDNRYRDLIPAFLPRLQRLDAQAHMIAHGYGDAVHESVERIASEAEKS